jgi:hypothetical protein
MDALIKSLNTEPALAWKLAVNVQGHAPNSSAAKKAAKVVKDSELVRALLSWRTPDGRSRFKPYTKWYGAHWILSLLADLGYPAGDESIRPMMDQTFEEWLSEFHLRNYVRMINDRVRRCASQEGNAIWSSCAWALRTSARQSWSSGSSAVAGRRLELRQAPRGDQLLLHGIAHPFEGAGVICQNDRRAPSVARGREGCGHLSEA